METPCAGNLALSQLGLQRVNKTRSGRDFWPLPWCRVRVCFDGKWSPIPCSQSPSTMQLTSALSSQEILCTVLSPGLATQWQWGLVALCVCVCVCARGGDSFVSWLAKQVRYFATCCLKWTDHSRHPQTHTIHTHIRALTTVSFVLHRIEMNTSGPEEQRASSSKCSIVVAAQWGSRLVDCSAHFPAHVQQIWIMQTEVPQWKLKAGTLTASKQLFSLCCNAFIICYLAPSLLTTRSFSPFYDSSTSFSLLPRKSK